MNIGETIEYLTLIRTAPDRNGHKYGVFRCVCGEEIVRIIKRVEKEWKEPKSCGCKRTYRYNRANIEKANAKRKMIAAKKKEPRERPSLNILSMKW